MVNFFSVAYRSMDYPPDSRIFGFLLLTIYGEKVLPVGAWDEGPLRKLHLADCVEKAGMDFTSIYLRTFFGARSFESHELDSLAKAMGVAERLSSNPKQRYFLLGASGATAANIGNKIVFGEKFYRRLTKEQLLAVAAHEFAHSTRQNDRLQVASVSLAVSVALAIVALAVEGSPLVAEVAFLVSFFPLLFGLPHAYGTRHDDEEIDCDDLAASFVSRDALASSILVAGEMSACRFRLRSGREGSTADERARRLTGERSIQ